MKVLEHPSCGVFMGPPISEEMKDFIRRNRAFAAHCIAIDAFVKSDRKVYYVPKDFAQAVSRIDRDIPVDVLPKKFIAYFQFAKDSIYDEAGEVEGGYVMIDTANALAIHETEKYTDPHIMLSFINNGGEFVGDFTAPLTNKKVAELTDSALDADGDYHLGLGLTSEEKKQSRLPVFRALINLAIYLHSTDPEMMALRPMNNMTHGQRREARRNLPATNMCTMPLTLLNWRYKMGIHYNVDSTVVQTHMRWQRCGPGNAQVKLIWVKEHERHYNKEVQNGDSQREGVSTPI